MHFDRDREFFYPAEQVFQFIILCEALVVLLVETHLPSYTNGISRAADSPYGVKNMAARLVIFSR